MNDGILVIRVPGGVQHGVWTHLHSFLIIRESIDITMLKNSSGDQWRSTRNEKIGIQTPLVALRIAALNEAIFLLHDVS